MGEIKIPARTQVLIGRPAQPMDQDLVRSIAELLKSVPEILEAHLPQCYVPSTMHQAAQILVVVLPATADVESALRPVRDGLS